MAEMFGFIKVRNGNVYIANRIFETRLYNMFLMSTDEQEKDVYREGARLKISLYMMVRWICGVFLKSL